MVYLNGQKIERFERIGKMITSAHQKDLPRCPYCVSNGEFRPMQILTNGREICEHCGHIVFPDDRAFWCPCQKCLEARILAKRQGEGM